MGGFLAWFSDYALGPVLAVLVVGGLYTLYLVGKVRRMIGEAVEDILGGTYTQTGGLRDLTAERLDHVVERIDSASREQHEATRRALEWAPAYTTSGPIPAPSPQASVLDARAAADEWLRRTGQAPQTGSVNAAATGAQGSRAAREVPVRSPWDSPTPPLRGPRTPTPEPAPEREVRRPNTSAALIGDRLAAEVRERRLDVPETVPPPPSAPPVRQLDPADPIDRRLAREPRHSLDPEHERRPYRGL